MEYWQYSGNGQTWLSDARSQYVAALKVADGSDRLTLLRSLIRLSGGRLDLDRIGIDLKSEDAAELSRFGIECSDKIVRLLDDAAEDREMVDLAALNVLDSQARRVDDDCPPDAVLLRHTSHKSYRLQAQKSSIRALLTMPDGAGLMVCMPTGAGKSLLFQIESLEQRRREPGSCVLVITPTVSLALDHQRTLSVMPGLENSRALAGASTQAGRDDRLDTLNAFRRGDVPVLFMSPELALGIGREHLLDAAASPDDKLAPLEGRLTTIVIDEAHIIESWGRTFRPDFQRLPALIDDLKARQPKLKTVVLSATLPPAARRVLRSAYKRAGDWMEIDARKPRREFDIDIKAFPNAQARDAQLDYLIDRAPRPLIVYTTVASERDDTDSFTENLTSAEAIFERQKRRGYRRIALFTGDTGGEERKTIVRDWARGDIDFVVATSAFGMGVDKANVRTVIHACLPDSPARYYQEIGRAARDGHQGLALALFTDTNGKALDDVKSAFSQATGSWLTRKKAEPRWNSLYHSRSDVAWNSGRMGFSVDLNALPEGSRSKRSSDYNRNWNMSLLNLLQRANAIQIVACDLSASKERWQIEVADLRLLEENASAAWDDVFNVRAQEQSEALQNVRNFSGIMRHPEDACILQTVFSLLQEPDADLVEECGRCPHCRARGILPPSSSRDHSVEGRWSTIAAPRPGIPIGITIVAPDDPHIAAGVEDLVVKLARAGVEQFITAPELATIVAMAIKETTIDQGFVLPHESVIGRYAVHPARVATALIVRRHDEHTELLFKQAKKWVDDKLIEQLILIADPSMHLQGRRLDQVMSKRAPYNQSHLDRSPGLFS
ncbi:DEAD/DEAH box helicase [Agrobacterium cavarae]|uniref:DEAD/DEAH box helicase n=1 Tax=Agrobacterium cavarae TaxID=2528239 RepID=UPI003FCF7005